MAYQAIGRGTSANDGTGDDLRTGAGKVNANFVEVYTLLGDGSTLTTDTVTLNTATQTLTNKTITGTFTGDITGNVSTSSGNLDLTPATQIVEVQGGGSNSGAITLNCEQNTHGQKIIAASHSALNSNSGNPATLTLPSTGAASQELVSTGATQTLTNKTLTAPTITGAGAIAGVFTGNITGDVTGNVTGDLTGDVTGNITGDVTGNITGDVTGNVTGAVDGIVGGTTPAAGSFTELSSSTHFQAAVYADTTARDAAITSPAAGMVAYLTATNKLQVYTGSAWETITSA
jgi:hypothetical protein